jgi:MFS transporter, CP family, cyanate transporter
VTGAPTAEGVTRGGAFLRLSLLWLAGADLRLTLLAVPPVLPLIHGDLALGETSVAALTGLPVLLLGVAAVPGSLLIARLGPRRALIAGLVVIAASSALRGVGPASAVLFSMSILMGAGIAVIQPALPSLVSRWFPESAALATAVYANGLLVGELASAGLTLPLVLPLVGGSWPLSFVVWGIPVAVTAFLIGGLTPHVPPGPNRKSVLWWPNWRNAEMWKLGLMQGGNGAIFFGANAFIPDYLHATGRGELVGICLSALNAGPILASILMLLFASRLARQRGPMMAAGALALLGLIGIFSSAPLIVVTGSAVLGFATGLALILLIALPPLLAGPNDAHRLSAGMFVIGFTASFVLPLLGGAAWDATGNSTAAFLPILIGALMILLISARMQFRVEGP